MTNTFRDRFANAYTDEIRALIDFIIRISLVQVRGRDARAATDIGATPTLDEVYQ
jgi:hypothetical protein